MIFI
ncbi:hypothetical protein VCHC56A1_0616, partial [Vibrio cholerae HC-56A1]